MKEITVTLTEKEMFALTQGLLNRIAHCQDRKELALAEDKGYWAGESNTSRELFVKLVALSQEQR